MKLLQSETAGWMLNELNDNSLYPVQLAATSLQRVNWAQCNHRNTPTYDPFLQSQCPIDQPWAVSVAGSGCCRSPLTIMILNVCRYVGCRKISWICSEGRPLRGFYQMPSKYSELFLNAIILTEMSDSWSVYSLGLVLLIRILPVPHGSNHFEGCH